MKIKPILKKVGLWLSLMVVIISGVWMINTWFNYGIILTFLTSLLAFIGCLTDVITRDSSRVFPPYVWKGSIILLIFSICMLIYSYCTSKPKLKITQPDANEQVNSSVSVSGFYQNIPLNQTIWLVVQNKSDGTFYLGDAVNVAKTGEKNGIWDSVSVTLGSYADGGKSFDIWALIIEQNSSAEDTILKYKLNYLIPSTRSLPPVLRSTKITVIRKP